MKAFVIARLIPGTAALFGGVVLLAWFGTGSIDGLELRVPGSGAPTLPAEPSVPSGPSHGELVISGGEPSDLPGAWPSFRGPGRDGVSPVGTSAVAVGLAKDWGEEGPPALWSVEVGEGHAGAAVLGGRVYVLDYDREKEADALRCLSLATGEEIWRYEYPVKVVRQHGMSRTVPAVTASHVVSLGPKCHVTCLNSTTGEFLWGLDLVEDFGAKVPQWYAGQCPLIDQRPGRDSDNARTTRPGRDDGVDRTTRPDGSEWAIIAPGGESLVMAVDCRTGEVVWRAPNPHKWEMTHISVAPMEYAGKRTYVYGGLRGVAGVSAEDGSILWDYTDWKVNVAWVATPVVVGEDRILLSGGYNAGCMMLRLREEEGRIVAERLWEHKARVFGSEQHTPVYYGGHIYGVRPDGEFVCLDPDGNVVWTSGSEHRFYKGYGPWLVADGMIYALDPGTTQNPRGELVLIEAAPDGYREIASAKILPGESWGHDAWGPMALAGGRLIVRDLTRMVCLDVGRGGTGRR